MTNTDCIVTIHKRSEDCGFGRIWVNINIDGYVSSIGTNEAAVALDAARKALAGEYDRCMAENEKPKLEEKGVGG